MLLVYQPNLDIVEGAVAELLAHVAKGMLELCLQSCGIGPAILRTCGSHGKRDREMLLVDEEMDYQRRK